MVILGKNQKLLIYKYKKYMKKNYIAEFDIEKNGLDIVLKIKVKKNWKSFLVT